VRGLPAPSRVQAPRRAHQVGTRRYGWRQLEGLTQPEKFLEVLTGPRVARQHLRRRGGPQVWSEELACHLHQRYDSHSPRGSAEHRLDLRTRPRTWRRLQVHQECCRVAHASTVERSGHRESCQTRVSCVSDGGNHERDVGAATERPARHHQRGFAARAGVPFKSQDADLPVQGADQVGACDQPQRPQRRSASTYRRRWAPAPTYGVEPGGLPKRTVQVAD